MFISEWNWQRRHCTMEDKKLFQIGEVAKMFQLSVGSLRHYEKAGLLKSEYTDKEVTL
jgi:hypothetical protein